MHHHPPERDDLAPAEECPLIRSTPRRALIPLALVLAVVSAGPAAAQVEQAEAAYKQARAAYKAGAYEEAVRHLETAWAAQQEPIFRFHMARSYEAAGKSAEAMQAALTFISLMAEKGADGSIYIEPLTESWAIVARMRAKTEAGPFELALPQANVCPKPVVTARGKQLEPRLEGLYWQVTVPSMAGGDLSVRCEGLAPPPSAPSGAGTAATFLMGAGAAGVAAGAYFGVRWFLADGELADMAPVADADELPGAARERTRARQKKDDFAESGLIVGGAGAALLLTGTILWLAADDDQASTALVPAVTADGAAVWWQGRF